MELDEIRAQYEHASAMSVTPREGFMRPKDGAILDEEKSVRWNREEVQRLRKEYSDEAARLSRARGKAINEAVGNAIQWIAENGGFTERQAAVIWNFVYERYHAYMGDVFNNLDEYMDFVNNIIKCGLIE